MTSFQISVSPRRRVAARFVESVRRKLQKAYAEATTISQSDIARELGVHRSVINRQLRGYQDMTLGRAAELSWALGYEPTFGLERAEQAAGQNAAPPPNAKFETAARGAFDGGPTWSAHGRDLVTPA